MTDRKLARFGQAAKVSVRRMGLRGRHVAEFTRDELALLVATVMLDSVQAEGRGTLYQGSPQSVLALVFPGEDVPEDVLKYIRQRLHYHGFRPTASQAAGQYPGWMVPEGFTWHAPDETKANHRPEPVKQQASGPVATKWASRIPGDEATFDTEAARDAHDQQTKGAVMQARTLIRSRRHGVTRKQQALLDLIRAEPGHARAYYAQALGVNGPVVSSLVAYLEDRHHLVFREGQGVARRYFPAPTPEGVGAGATAEAVAPTPRDNGHAPAYGVVQDPAAYISPDAATLILVELSELEDRRESLQVALAALRKADG